MERLTVICPGGTTIGTKYGVIQSVIDDSRLGEVFDKLGGYEDTGLTPEEVARLHTLIKQQGEELQRRDSLIRELDKERDYWEREAKKHCAELGEIKIYNMLRPIEEWGEDYGDCLWWRIPIKEPPYCGNPLDSEWEEKDYDTYYTHFTRLVIPNGIE